MGTTFSNFVSKRWKKKQLFFPSFFWRKKRAFDMKKKAEEEATSGGRAPGHVGMLLWQKSMQKFSFWKKKLTRLNKRLAIKLIRYHFRAHSKPGPSNPRNKLSISWMRWWASAVWFGPCIRSISARLSWRSFRCRGSGCSGGGGMYAPRNKNLPDCHCGASH